MRATDQLEVRSWKGLEAMDSLESEWRRLHRLSAPGLFQGFDWMRLWMRHFGRERGAAIYTVGRGGTLDLIVPLRLRRAGPRPVGVTLAATVGTRHLPCNDPVRDPERLEPSLEALARHLARVRGARVLRFVGLPEESGLSVFLREARGRWGRALSVENRHCRNRLARIEEGFEAYYRSRGRKLRTEGRTDLRKLAKRGPVSVRLHRSLDGAPEALEDYFDLYSRSWQKSERHEGFFREALELLSSLGALRLFFFEIDGRPVAAQLLAVEGERAYNLKNFFDSEYRKQSPGTVLAFDALRRTVERDGARSVDYMKGDQEYKARWASDLRRRFDWTVPLGRRGILALGFWRLLGRGGETAPDPD